MADETKIVGIKVTADTGAGVNSMRQMEDASASLLGGMGRLDKGVGGFQSTVVALGAAMGALAFANFAGRAVDAANQVDRAAMGLATTARYTGVALDEANRAAKSLTEDGLMSVAEASKALQNLLSRGFSLPEAIQLMNGFKDSAAFGRQASLGFGESIVGATEGLKNENSILVDNAGVTKNVSVMWKEYASQHGTTVDKLTQSQKRHAELNGILRETEGQVGNADRMMNSFAGSQAKAAQQAFELKAAFGTGLQPVIKATLDILGPVVSTLKDMVYWVETLGASAGAAYDKLALRASIALSGKGMFSKEGMAEYDAGIKTINANRDATIDEVMSRWLGGNIPDIGNDTGKRRKDSDPPPKTGADTKSEKRAEAARIAREAELTLNSAMEVGTDALTAYHKELDDIASIRQQMSMDDLDAVRNGEAYLNYLGQLSDAQQKVFDTSSMQSEWAGRNANSDRAAQQQGDSFSAAMAQNGGDGGYAEQRLQIEQESEWRIQNWAMQTDSFEEFKRREVLIATDAAARIKELDANVTMTKMQTAQRGFTVASGLVNDLNTLSANKSKELQAVSKVVNTGMAIANTAVGVTQALKSAPPPYSFILAGLVAAAGAAQVGVIASSDTGGGGSMQGLGHGNGTYSPVVEQPTGGASQQQGGVTVQIMGNVIGEDRWVEENLVPALNQAGSRGVTIQYVN